MYSNGSLTIPLSVNNKPIDIMKFLLCLVLCFAAAHAGLVGLPGAGLTYASPYTTYSAGVAGLAGIPSLYNSPLAYSAFSGIPTTYSAGLAVPSVYSTSGLGLGVGVGLGGHLVRSAYAAPTVLSAPSVYSTLLKK